MELVCYCVFAAGLCARVTTASRRPCLYICLFRVFEIVVYVPQGVCSSPQQRTMFDAHETSLRTMIPISSSVQSAFVCVYV